MVTKGYEDDIYIQKPSVPDHMEFDEDEEIKGSSQIDFDNIPLGRYGDDELKYAEKGIDYSIV